MQLSFVFDEIKPRAKCFPTVIFDPAKSTEFPYCLDQDRVLWGIPSARREFLKALQNYREDPADNISSWLAADLMRLGGLGAIW